MFKLDRSGGAFRRFLSDLSDVLSRASDSFETRERGPNRKTFFHKRAFLQVSWVILAGSFASRSSLSS